APAAPCARGSIPANTQHAVRAAHNYNEDRGDHMGIDEALGWHKLSWTKKILIALPILAAVIGWEYYQKHQESKEMMAKMVGMCAGDQKCLDTVAKHEEACFDEHYHMGRHSQGVLMDEFVACINEKAGEQMFVSVPKQ